MVSKNDYKKSEKEGVMMGEMYSNPNLLRVYSNFLRVHYLSNQNHPNQLVQTLNYFLVLSIDFHQRLREPNY